VAVLAVHEPVALELRQRLGEHPVADAVDGPAQRAEAQRPAAKRAERQGAPAPGHVLERLP
jgi:hypothetical protein